MFIKMKTHIELLEINFKDGLFLAVNKSFRVKLSDEDLETARLTFIGLSMTAAYKIANNLKRDQIQKKTVGLNILEYITIKTTKNIKE
tara:strand:+ start:1148 stop:1411 length:264 start_codon:yes stop_codon:yes gene_type:complete